MATAGEGACDTLDFSSQQRPHNACERLFKLLYNSHSSLCFHLLRSLHHMAMIVPNLLAATSPEPPPPLVSPSPFPKTVTAASGLADLNPNPPPVGSVHFPGTNISVAFYRHSVNAAAALPYNSPRISSSTNGPSSSPTE